jgi:hypothetical protein
MESAIRTTWLKHLVSVEPADRPRTESALRDLYIQGGFAPPAHFFWFDSPLSAALAVFMVEALYDGVTSKLLDAMYREKGWRGSVDRVRADLCQTSGLEWKALTDIIGQTIMESCWIPNETSPIKTVRFGITLEIIKAQKQLYATGSDPGKRPNHPSVAGTPNFFDGRGVLFHTERCLSSVLKSAAGALGTKIQSTFASHYSFFQMAMDEEDSLGRDVPPILEAAWSVSKCAGRSWWLYSGCVILSERPAEVHLNDRWVLHGGESPALRYRDGTALFAWDGVHVRSDWMMHPERIPPFAFELYDSSFRRYVKRRLGTPARKARLKPSKILKNALPTEPGERVELLRSRNGGRLPLFDRYIGGEYQKVWEELIALGPSVREDPAAADGLAVAYETMRRVDSNVETLAARLRSIGYRYKNAQPHQGPGPRKAWKQIARLEKAAGTLPLSLRAFYDVVGAVNFIGEHAAIDPPGNSIPPDPLVVEPVEHAFDPILSKAEETDDEDVDNGQALIIIAPDALHKADTSGGEPYEIAVPELRADGPLIGERHQLFFVEYLRLVFRFGGFPGYEGIDPVPAELGSLGKDLIPF